MRYGPGQSGTTRRSQRAPKPAASPQPPPRHASEISTGLPTPREQRRLTRPLPAAERRKQEYEYAREQARQHAWRLYRAGDHLGAIKLAQAWGLTPDPGIVGGT